MATKYIPIDKKAIIEGVQIDFNLFVALNSNKNKVARVKESGSYITSDDIFIIDTSRILYVKEEEFIYYKKFHKNFLSTAATSKSLDITQKVADIYMNASSSLNNLFNDPETLGNYEASKVVVGEIVDVVLHDKFTIKSLLSIATHDYYTHTHSINVAIYALTLGDYLGLNKSQLSELGESALLHDLGKSKIDLAIINKNGKLTDDEFEKIKEHPSLGHKLALNLGVKNTNVLNGIRHHHEKMDGSGYPFKMTGTNIPYYARIIGICDIFDALTSRRSYKKPMTTFEALKLIKIEMKRHVDPKILNQMIMMFR